MPNWPPDDHLWIYRAASVNLRLDSFGHLITDDIRATLRTLDKAAEGRLFETPTVVSVTLDEDAVSFPSGDLVSIIAVLAGVILCVSIGV